VEAEKSVKKILQAQLQDTVGPEHHHMIDMPSTSLLLFMPLSVKTDVNASQKCQVSL